MPFYNNEPSQALRFGDVVQGYVSATPTIKWPRVPHDRDEFSVEVDKPRHLAILSPCCSIGDQVVLLAPLIGIRPSFFDNPFFSDDLTRINRPMAARDAVPPNTWDKFPENERVKRLEQGKAYTFLELFVYEGHDLLPKYSVNHPHKGKIESSEYMIDFRHTFRLNYGRIRKPTDAVESKILELSIQTRSELRDKISHFYGRIPDEDRDAA